MSWGRQTLNSPLSASFTPVLMLAAKAGMVHSLGHLVVPVVSHLHFLGRLVGNFIAAYGVHPFCVHHMCMRPPSRGCGEQ